MKRYIITSCLLVGLLIPTASAQFNDYKLRPNEFAISGFAGLAMHLYQVPGCRVLPAFGGGAGLSYTYFFDGRMGIQTGVNLQFAGANVRSSDYQWEIYSTDPEGENFLYRSHYTKLRERERAMGVTIPLLFAYRDEEIYTSFGLSMWVPIQGSFSRSAETLETEGYYPHYLITYRDLPELGFFNREESREKGKYPQKTLWGIHGEVGYPIDLNENQRLCIGIVVEWFFKRKGDGVVAPLEYNSAQMALPIAHAVNQQAYGLSALGLQLKLSYTFGFGEYKKPIRYAD